MPSFSNTVEIDAPPEQVFEILDDVSRTPQWLSRCTGIDKLDSGPNRVGTRLRYHYKNGSRPAYMDGEITAHQPSEHIGMVYRDRMMTVAVDFATRMGARRGTTTLTHSIDITPKGLGKLFTPLITRTLPRQTIDAMRRLKTLAETATSP